jgi:hypothetical protein
MALGLPWIVFPLVFAALALGCGLLVEWIAGRRLPSALLLPAGFAVVLVASSLTTMWATTAGLTSPLVVALAVAGFGLALPAWRRPNAWASGAALAVFLVYAAPIVLSGSATFAGYISLDDTATWLAIADNALVHGRSLAGLAPSTFSAVLHDDLPGGYPIGSMVPLGIGHELTGQDAAWLFQPYVAFLGGLLALTIYALIEPLVLRRWLAAAVTFVGAQPALLYGYAFWSGIKEVTVAYLVALIAALAVSGLAGPWSVRRYLPLAVAMAALLVCVSVLGAVWLAGLGLFALLLARSYGARPAATSAAFVLACSLILGLPALTAASTFIDGAAHSDAGNGGLGNLIHPLSNLQLLGIWPTGDFRGRPTHMGTTYLLLALLALAAGFGLIQAARRRVWGLVMYVALCLIGWALVITLDALGHGSPWLDAKALASASPALLAAALAGGALLIAGRRRLVGAIALAGVTAGVLWSNALAYRSVWLAPRDQLTELETIGTRFAGGGPTLMTEYQPYGVRHFLRNLDAEGASERRVRPVYLRDGGVLRKEAYADLDAFDLRAVLVYRTLVLRSSPVESRPPSVYVPVWADRWYEVWQRPLATVQTLEHLSLGSDLDPEGVPPCRDVRSLALMAEHAHGMLVAAQRPKPEVVDLATAKRPPTWAAGAGGTVLPNTSGTLSTTIRLPRRGVFGFWLGGSFRDRLRLIVDGRTIGTATDQLEETSQLTPFGTVVLHAGEHLVELRYGGSGWRPGMAGAPFLLGPLVVGVPATESQLLRVRPGSAASLCGRPLDWIEVVAPGQGPAPGDS